MIEPRQIILGVLVTEKSERLKQNESKYTFRVAPSANKVTIRQAVEKLFKVHVTDVKVMMVGGKQRRMGLYMGYRPDWKKAVVTVKQGERIEALER
ncbi:MAG: 50S ribosomal protein L23 [candidate division WOR-3 bacterium]